MALPARSAACARLAESPSCSHRSAPWAATSRCSQRLRLQSVSARPSIISCRASVVSGDASGDGARGASSGPLERMSQLASALPAFSRPHTMIGTALSVTSISALALSGVAPDAAAATALLQALSSALLMNVAIVGINQLYDIEIDKVNKPYLPLASGAMTPAQGLATVVATAAVATAIGVASGSPPLLFTLLLSLLLGLIYSADLPFMRWKRSPVLAAGCILAVRAILVQLGFYAHMRQAVVAAAAAAATASAAAAAAAPAAAALPTAAAAAAAVQPPLLVAPLLLTPLASACAAVFGPASQFSPSLLFVLGFMLFFSVVIALFKDLPDVAGDSRAGLRTLSVRMGEGAVFRICVALLSVAYAWAMVASLVLPPGGALARGALCAGHAALCGLLLHRARGVDTSSPAALTRYYMFVWKLFYAEYLLIPLFG